MSATAASTRPRYRRRESGRSVVHRLHAIPVQLLPLHVFTLQHVDGEVHGNTDKGIAPLSRAAASNVARGDTCAELGVNSVCLVTSAAAAVPSMTSAPRPSATGESALFSSLEPPAAEQRLAYEVAAAHALRGGRVLFLSAPTRQAFSLARFAVTVEGQWVALQRLQQEARSAGQADTAERHNAQYARQVGCAGCTPSPSACTVPPVPPLQSLSSDALLRARQQAVLDAVQRVEVLPCTSMDDLYAVCQAYTFPTIAAEAAPREGAVSAVAPDSLSSALSPVASPRDSGRLSSASEPRVAGERVFPSSSPLTESGGVASTSAAETSAAPLTVISVAASPPTPARVCTPDQADIVPLCIVEGFMGSLSTPALLERASGQVILLPHYLLCLLQRRLKCAVMVLEGGASVAMDSSARWARSLPAACLPSAGPLLDQHPRKESDMCAALPSPSTVLAASDLVQRLRSPHVHPPTAAPVSPALWPLKETSMKSSSQVGGAVARQPGRKAARAESVGEHSACSLFSHSSAVSLYDVQLSVAYVEWDAVWGPLRHGDRNLQACGAWCGATSLQDELLLPSSVAWRYRVHLMKTCVGEAADARVGAADNLLPDRQSTSSESLWAPSRGSRRSSGVLSISSRGPSSLHYTGAWVRSSQWRHL
ncbi:hypothetical protein LSCM1_02896 [Leishmania martiniquensis]|uniref:Uncharacterized protein n=1 Tax=Leishmania martiniquensis TaxID=1580590 RepID=A0A836GBS2_9TRYP|nr:hypothetical protein LSCM1_02896 [Leishmania martiniquensis]